MYLRKCFICMDTNGSQYCMPAELVAINFLAKWLASHLLPYFLLQFLATSSFKFLLNFGNF